MQPITGAGDLPRRGPPQVERDVASGDAVGECVVGLEVAGQRHRVAEAMALDVLSEIVVLRHAPGQQQVRGGDIRARCRKCPEP